MDDVDDAGTLCSRCARRQKTCCQKAAVFITRGDIERIAASVPEAASSFWEMREVGDLDFRGGSALDEIWGTIVGADGRVRIVRHRENGDCFFLGEDGCRLDLAARPLVCRLYPYEYTPASLTGVNAHLCPYPECGNAPLILALLGMNRDAAEQWRQALYREILGE